MNFANDSTTTECEVCPFIIFLMRYSLCTFSEIAVLTLYMRNILKFDEDLSTVLYHLFIMLCYFTPILGAIIADTYLGKFT